MAHKTLFMETTAIDASKTAGEIVSLLVASGAQKIVMEYENQRLTGISFLLLVNGVVVPFKLPVRVDPIFKILNGRRKYSYDRTQMAAKDRAQAERVAWRQLLRWVQSQFAMVDVGMAAAPEVFLPYMQEQGGKTLYEVLVATRFKALPAPEVPQ